MSKPQKPSYFFGIHAAQAIIAQRPEDVLALFVQSERAQKQDPRLIDMLADAQRFGISVQHTQKTKLDNLAGSTQHQGIVAHARPKTTLTESDIDALFGALSATPKADAPALFLLLDQVSDPHNLGAIMRTACAMGVTAVITTKDNAASLTPTACKVATGAAELIPFVQVTNLVRTIKQLKNLGCFVVGTALDASAKTLGEHDLTSHTALVMGAEEKGLRRLTLETCDALAYLPMLGDIQSLNVSVATGMALYEAVRQRGYDS